MINTLFSLPFFESVWSTHGSLYNPNPMPSAKDSSSSKQYASLQEKSGSQPEPFSVRHPMVQKMTSSPSLNSATDGPAEPGTTDEKPGRSVLDEAAPGPSKQPWRDHRAYIQKQPRSCQVVEYILP